MIMIDQSVEILDSDNSVKKMKAIEYAGRNCYASQDKITEDSYERFIRNLIKNRHDAPLEFADMTVDITTSRAVLAEITRHRLSSFCVESQRYIQEAKTGDITFIVPTWNDHIGPDCVEWVNQMRRAEKSYKDLIAYGLKPEQAREVLPNSTACRIIMKANLREWRHIFNLRCSKAAYPQMRELMLMLLEQAYKFYPAVFEDIYNVYSEEIEQHE